MGENLLRGISDRAGNGGELGYSDPDATLQWMKYRDIYARENKAKIFLQRIMHKGKDLCPVQNVGESLKPPMTQDGHSS